MRWPNLMYPNQCWLCIDHCICFLCIWLYFLIFRLVIESWESCFQHVFCLGWKHAVSTSELKVGICLPFRLVDLWFMVNVISHILYQAVAAHEKKLFNFSLTNWCHYCVKNLYFEMSVVLSRLFKTAVVSLGDCSTVFRPLVCLVHLETDHPHIRFAVLYDYAHVKNVCNNSTPETVCNAFFRSHIKNGFIMNWFLFFK